MPVLKFDSLPEWPEGYEDPLFSRDEMANLLAQPGHAYWMVTQKLPDASQIEAGHVLARVDKGSFADVLSVYVRPELRRLGHGQMLLATVITEAHKNGALGVTLEVREGNTGARALYEACGMGAQSVRKGYYKDPQEDAVVYTLELPH